MTDTIGTAQKTDILIEVLPYIQQFERTTFVIKYGGAAMQDETLKRTVAQDITLLRKIGIDVVVVHGGGREITEFSKKLNLKTRFVNGQRFTDQETRDVVQMVMVGSVNVDLVRLINIYGGRAVGVSGIDASLLSVRKLTEDDLGLVGIITEVNAKYIRCLSDSGYLPVIAPLGIDGQGTVYNVNADSAAGAIASALSAEKLVYLTDVEGILSENGLLPHLSSSEAKAYANSGVIYGGMIPKVTSALSALESGVQKVHIIDGRIPHSLLLEIFTTSGIGTEIVHAN